MAEIIIGELNDLQDIRGQGWDDEFNMRGDKQQCNLKLKIQIRQYSTIHVHHSHFLNLKVNDMTKAYLEAANFFNMV